MLDNHAKLLYFFSKAKQVTGRKKLQKMIYILQQCRVPFEEKYQFHFYGPYSEELTLRVEELCNLNFLNEEKEEKSNYHQYHYSITEDGATFLKQFEVNIPGIEDRISVLQDCSARFLELVSTVLYFSYLPREEIIDKVHTVKPKLKYTEEEMKEAFQFIDELQDKSSH